MPSTCPKCGSQHAARGTVLNLPDYFRPTAYFKPKGLRSFVITGITVNFKNNFFSCVDCGLVWASLDPEKLRTVIRRKAKENIRQELGLAEEE